MIRTLRLTSLILAMMFVTGCDEQPDSEIKAYVLRVRSQKPKPVPPLPEISTYKGERYTGYELRSPFEVPLIFKQVLVEQTVEKAAYTGPRPDFTRKRTLLEVNSLESYVMVGTILDGSTLWGIIKDKSNAVYRVKKDDYVGQNFGRILKVSESRIDVTEMLPDGQGGWRERINGIAMGN